MVNADNIRNHFLRCLLVCVLSHSLYILKEVSNVRNIDGITWITSLVPLSVDDNGKYNFDYIVHNPSVMFGSATKNYGMGEFNSTSTIVDIDSMCHRIGTSLGNGAPVSAARIWRSEWFQSRLRQATFAALKECWWFHNFETFDMAKFESYTESQLEKLTPVQLKRAIRTSAHPFIMQRVFETVLKRIREPENNPPLKIAVFGGSVTEGCRAAENNPFGLHNMQARYRPNCTWVAKLETLINAMGGIDIENGIVQVHNYAIAGTDSDIASAMLEYQMVGNVSLAEYDVFISAFSSNDALAPPGRDRDRHILTMQRLNRLFYDQRPCKDLPLIIQVEDTLLDTINIQGPVTIYDGLRYSREMVETNAWAGGHFMSVSYSDAIRDQLYKDKQDTTLHTYSSLHPGYNFNTGLAYTLLYSFLEGAISGACDASMLDNGNRTDMENRLTLPLPMITDQNKNTASDLIILWEQQRIERSQMCNDHKQFDQGVIPGTASVCEFSWIGAQWQTKTREMVRDVMGKYVVENKGFFATGNIDVKPKRSWSAEKEGSHFTMQLDKLHNAVNSLVVVFMRTDNPKWQGSAMEVTVEQSVGSEGQRDWKEIHRDVLNATHETRSTINYARRMKFQLVEAGSNLRVSFTMVSGIKFEIHGMALCHVTPSSITDLTSMPDGYEDPTETKSSRIAKRFYISKDSVGISPQHPIVPTPQIQCPQRPCDINIAFVGDSITRYQYYSLAYFFRYNRWIDPNTTPNLIRPKDYMEGNEFGMWTTWYNVSTAALQPYENCDCYRRKGYHFLKDICENRYYHDPTRNITLTYIQAFGTNVPIRGHWEADNAFLAQAQKEMQDREETSRLAATKGPPSIGPFYVPYPFTWSKNWTELITEHLAKISPSHVVMNAGKWKHNFDDIRFASKIKEALDASQIIGVWKTTTSEIHGKYYNVRNWPGENWNKTDHIMCELFAQTSANGGDVVVGGGCLNNSGWTQLLSDRFYMDEKHFVEPVYRKLNEEVLDHLKIERTIPNLDWSELGINNPDNVVDTAVTG